MTTRDELRHLADELDADAAREALARLQDLRLPRFLRDAPTDDEPETEEERAAVAEAEADLAAGRVVSHDEIRREFGLGRDGPLSGPTELGGTCGGSTGRWRSASSAQWSSSPKPSQAT